MGDWNAKRVLVRGRARNAQTLTACPGGIVASSEMREGHACQARPRGSRLHDYWQQAGKRGAAKEVRFPGFRPDGDRERRADHGGERDEAQMVREEGGGGRARRAVDRAVDAPLGTRLGVPRVQHPHRVGVHRAGGLDDDEDDLSALGEGIGECPACPAT